LFEGFTYPRKFRRPGDDRKKAGRLLTGLWQSLNSLGFCYFVILQQKYPLTGLINAATGWDIDMEEIITTGLRIQTLRQAFNLREGVNTLKNKLPERAHAFDDYLEDYQGVIEEMGWDPDSGKPTKETLAELNLDFLIKDLY
jgi:aldehyde:ferredoxin oxidoreductase